MARALDVHALSGRTLGAVLDEIAPGWADWGFGPRGPFGLPIWAPGDPPLSAAELQAGAEIRRRLTPIIAALRDGVVEIVSIVGVVPRQVWFSGRWTVRYAVERGVWLEVWDEAGRKTEHDAPRFAVPGQPAAGKKNQASRGKRGNTRFDDTAVVALAREEYAKMSKPSKTRAAAAVIARLIAEKRPIAGQSCKAWVDRVRRQL
jgi:hypothetical protein